MPLPEIFYWCHYDIYWCWLFSIFWFSPFDIILRFLSFFADIIVFTPLRLSLSYFFLSLFTLSLLLSPFDYASSLLSLALRFIFSFIFIFFLRRWWWFRLITRADDITAYYFSRCWLLISFRRHIISPWLIFILLLWCLSLPCWYCLSISSLYFQIIDATLRLMIFYWCHFFFSPYARLCHFLFAIISLSFLPLSFHFFHCWYWLVSPWCFATFRLILLAIIFIVRRSFLDNIAIFRADYFTPLIIDFSHCFHRYFRFLRQPPLITQLRFHDCILGHWLRLSWSHYWLPLTLNIADVTGYIGYIAALYCWLIFDNNIFHYIH